MPHYPRFLTRALILTTCSLALLSSTRAQTAGEKIDLLISEANLGKPPVLWFASDPKINLGTGPKIWAAQSGGQLAARGADAWGRPAAAFGLAGDAKGGVAVSGSTATNVINPKSGAVLLFFRPSENAVPPMMLFSRADWGNPNYLSLRINSVAAQLELALGVADARSKDKAVQAPLATLTPGAWTFVAVTWREIDGLCRFNYWAGDLASGELTEGGLETTPLDPAPGIFMLAGRRADTIAKYATDPLLFTGGLLQHFALYDEALSEDVVKRIYLAARHR